MIVESVAGDMTVVVTAAVELSSAPISHVTVTSAGGAGTIYEHAMPTPQKKRTSARQFKSNKRTDRISDIFVGDEGE